MLSFHVKCMQTYRLTERQTDRRMDGQTTVKQYAPDLSILGHKNQAFRENVVVESSWRQGLENKRAKMALDRSPDFFRLL